MPLKDIFLRNRFICAAAFYSLLIGLITSIYWVYPLLQDFKTARPSLVPIRMHLDMPHYCSDNYLYFSQVSEVFNGNLFFHDPASFEGKLENRYPVHVTYSISLWLLSVGGLFTKNTAHAYYFALFFYSALATFFVAWLAYALTANSFAALSVAVLTLHLNRQLEHLPHPLTAQIPIFLVLLLFFCISQNCKPKSALAAIAVLVGLSPFTSVPNLFISYGLLAGFGLTNFHDKILRSRIVATTVVALVISAPQFLILLKNSPVFYEILEFTLPPIEQYHRLDTSRFLTVLGLFALTLISFMICRFNHRKFLIGGTLGFAIAYISLTVFHGTMTGNYVMLVGSMSMCCLFFSGFFLILNQARKQGTITLVFGFRSIVVPTYHFSVRRHLKQYLWGGLILVTAATLLYRTKIVWTNTVALLPYQFDQNFKELSIWAKNETKTGDVAISLDFDLIFNLIVYAPIDVYIPEVLLSPIPQKDRFQRLHETLWYYGISPQDFGNYLDKDKQNLIFRVAIFYGKYWGDKNFPESVKAELISQYRNFLEQKANSLTFRHTHLILSERDLSQMSENSPAARAISNLNPIFKNSTYRVYQLAPH